ncbi:MAG: hypothetical protein A2136_09830 [Chloroflexi bacterium RBG_16_54_11]|nr:MAG: hypothetical protein A2136_09830 [Chloroflexi bacterium RBG_16_54_11]
MNLDGIPEIITNEQSGHMNVSHSVMILEWEGHQFESIIQGESYAEGKHFNVAFMDGVTEVSIRDIDDNKTLELILNSNGLFEGTYAYISGAPWRKETHIYSWNGELFVLYRVEFSPPDYRFQAVQDGDRASLVGDYDLALGFYQEAILSDELDWWSNDRWDYEIRSKLAHTTPVPTPILDFREYPNLAAYASYRILLLHVVQGSLHEAEIVFNMLKEKFMLGQPGFTYVELATSFWNEFQTSSNIGQACAKAIEYASMHPFELLSYLGNGEYARTYYGDQSLEYQPEDICPLR